MRSTVFLKKQVFTIACFCLGLTASSAFGQPFRNSIVSTDFDFITKNDPSTYAKIEFVKLAKAEMPDKRYRGKELMQKAYQFDVSFTDNTSVSIFIDAKIGSKDAAKKDAIRFVHPLGKLPTSLRRGVKRLCIHQGGKTTTAFADVGLIVMYSDNASVRISNHDLEETIFHESVHAAWDKQHANSKGWKKAQASDGNFATMYAKSKPTREDLAESALFAYTILHHPKRLPADVRQTLAKSIPARITFVGNLLPPDQPIHFKIREGLAKTPPAESSDDPKTTRAEDHAENPVVLCDVRLGGIAKDVIANCLKKEFSLHETKVIKFLMDELPEGISGELVFQATLKHFDVDGEKLRTSILKNLHINCEHAPEFDDSKIRKAVKQWKVAN